MPQTYNPLLENSQDDSPMGQSSRYMKAINASSILTRRAQAITELDKRQLQKRLKGVEVYAQRAERRFERIRKHLQDRIQVKKAHNLVTQSMSFTIESNYQRALRERHLEQFRARQFDRRVKYVLKRMDPALKRESEAKSLLEQARFESKRDIENSKNTIIAICGLPKPGRHLEVPSRTSDASSTPSEKPPTLGSKYSKLGPITKEKKDDRPPDVEVIEKEESADRLMPVVEITVENRRKGTPIPLQPAEISRKVEAATKLGVTTKPYYGRSRSNTNLFSETSNVSAKAKPVIKSSA